MAQKEIACCMNLKQTILFTVANIAGILDIFLRQTNKYDGDFFKGIGTGTMIVLAIQIVPKLVKETNETPAK